MAPKSRAAPSSSCILDYLQSSLPRSTLLELYNDDDRGRFVCRAVLQQLSQVAQQVVMRLLSCGGSFPVASVQVWTKLKPHEWGTLVAQLDSWAIVGPITKEQDMQLTAEFSKGLYASVTSLESSPWSALSPAQLEALLQQAAPQETKEKAAQKLLTPEDLERYTQAQWDAVLHFLVGTPNYRDTPPPAVTNFLLETGLMQTDPEYRGRDPSQAPLVITNKGYDFMLQDTQHQVWHFVSQYLKSLESHKKHKHLIREALLFLICLSYTKVGDAYLAAQLSKDGRVLMKDMKMFGLLRVQKLHNKTSIFYPTRVALQLVSTSDGDDSSSSTTKAASMWTLSSKALESSLAHPRPHDSSHLAIIVQTNFQVCAYTTSELHVSMLGLFCDVGTIRRLPNVVFMKLTRDSVKQAFALGIQATQILKFLEKHAHPKLRVGSSSSAAGTVPQNVRDQIWLWDRERHRVQWTKVYQHGCLMRGEFEAVRQYAVELGAHAWSSAPQQQLLLDYKYVEQIQQFARQWRARAAAAAHGE